MCIFCGVVFTSILVIIFMGPERFHKNLKIHDHNNEIQQASDKQVGTVDNIKEIV